MSKYHDCLFSVVFISRTCKKKLKHYPICPWRYPPDCLIKCSPFVFKAWPLHHNIARINKIRGERVTSETKGDVLFRKEFIGDNFHRLLQGTLNRVNLSWNKEAGQPDVKSSKRVGLTRTFSEHSKEGLWGTVHAYTKNNL